MKFGLISTGALLSLSLVIGSGCTGLEPAMLGAAATGVQAGSSVSSAGKINSAWIASFDQVIAACEAACGDVGMVIVSSNGSVDYGKWIIVAMDEHEDKYKIHINRETRKLSRFQVDVGWFGPRPIARLMVKRIAVNLYDQGLGPGGDIPMDDI